MNIKKIHMSDALGQSGCQSYRGMKSGHHQNPSQGEHVIKVSSVKYKYDSIESSNNRTVFSDLNLTIPTGTFASIIGPSGCGKSTLLMLLSGLLQPSHGTIELDHSSPDKARFEHRIGLVLQKPVFLGWRNVIENVRLSAEIANIPGSNEKASELIDAFQLSEFKDAFPHELSGGMLSRVAIARALAHEPQYLLLDEAFNNLDEVLREKVYLHLERVWLKRRPTVLSVTHTLSEAVLFSDNIFLLSQRPARVIDRFQIELPRPREPKMLNIPEVRDLMETIRAGLHNSWHAA